MNERQEMPVAFTTDRDGGIGDFFKLCSPACLVAFINEHLDLNLRFMEDVFPGYGCSWCGAETPENHRRVDAEGTEVQG